MFDNHGSESYNFLAKIFEVVGFAVVCDPVTGDWIIHRLMTGCGSIDDREARVAKHDFPAVKLNLRRHRDHQDHDASAPRSFAELHQHSSDE